MENRPDLLKLNLGCGMRKRDGYVNVDSSPVCAPDLVLDLESSPWPWADNTVGEVVLIHVLEHLGQHPSVYLGIMKELWRVCVDGAHIHIEVPHPRSDEFLGDPTHVRPITADGLALFSHRNNAEYERVGAANTPLGRYLGIDFELVSSSLIPKKHWLERLRQGEITESELRNAGESQWNVYANYHATLQVVKPAGRLVIGGGAAGDANSLRRAADAALAENRLGEAAGLLERLSVAAPNDLEARCLLAACLHASGDLEGARRHYQLVVDRGAQSFELFNNLGVVCLELGESAVAVRHFSTALEIQPGDRVARANLAEAKAEAGDVRDAIELLMTLVEEQPDDAGTYVVLAKIYIDQGWFNDAANALQLARQFGAESLDLINQEGIVRRELFQYEAALERFDTALAQAPDSVPLLTNRANVLGWLHRDADAESAYQQALALSPNDSEAAFSYACFLLMRERVEPGWRYYEARWERGDVARTRRPQSLLPQWLGETSNPLADDLLVFCEQGFGDNLQFVRLLPRIRDRFRRIVLVARPALQQLLARSLEGVAEVVSEHPPESGFRWQVPLVSIAHALRLPVAAWGAPPYLRADEMKSTLWQGSLPNDGRKRVGLCWSGGKRARYRHRFDLPLAAAGHLLTQQKVNWVSLQADGCEEWRKAQVNAGLMCDPMPQVRDFDDTAALIAGLDLVVSTDTAVAHLAAAMGKPVWLLLSSEGEWRWLQERRDSPWYPSMQIYRQSAPGDWDSVVAAVRAALD